MEELQKQCLEADYISPVTNYTGLALDLASNARLGTRARGGRMSKVHE